MCIMVYQPVDAVANPNLQMDPPLKELSSGPDVLLQGRQRETSTHTIPGLGQSPILSISWGPLLEIEDIVLCLS